MQQSALLTTAHQSSLFSTASPTLACWFIYDTHSNRIEVMSHCGFNLHFSENEWHWASLYMSIGHLYVLFGEVSVWVLCSFFNWIVGGFLGGGEFGPEFHNFFINFGYPLSDISLANTSSHQCVVFSFYWWFLLLGKSF